VKARTLRYFTAAVLLPPPIGAILMGETPRTKRAYLVLNCRRSKGKAGLGMATYALQVEPMSSVAGQQEIDAGAPLWPIRWSPPP
jgi:hypothetical protein